MLQKHNLGGRQDPHQRYNQNRIQSPERSTERNQTPSDDPPVACMRSFAIFNSKPFLQRCSELNLPQRLAQQGKLRIIGAPQQPRCGASEVARCWEEKCPEAAENTRFGASHHNPAIRRQGTQNQPGFPFPSPIRTVPSVLDSHQFLPCGSWPSPDGVTTGRELAPSCASPCPPKVHIQMRSL